MSFWKDLLFALIFLIYNFLLVNKSDSIRLVNGSFATNGRLEVRLKGRGSWGTVCDDGFTKNDARVACRELGLPT